MIKERELYKDLIQHLNKTEYSIIIGARQVGKTTIIQEMYKKLKKEGNEVFFISFEDFNILNDINQNNENLFHYVKHPTNPLLSKNEARIIVFIDEIQYANNPSNLLKYLYDTYQENLKVIAAGSRAFYIDSKFKDSLAGRKRIFHLQPVNFNEFLTFKDAIELKQELHRIRNDENYISKYYMEILNYFNEYLTYGGYPKIALESNINEKKLYLDELITSFLKKDIYESKIEQEQKFYNLCTLLAAQIGMLVNKNELAKTLSLNLRTLEKYLFILQKCFYINFLPPFYKNIRKEITKMSKIYFHDLGIRNKLLNRFDNIKDRDDKGYLLENYFFIRLNELFATNQIKFWRTADQNEVDFVVNEQYDKGKAFEIKYNDSFFKEKTYKKFINTYPNYPLKCISYLTSNTGFPVLKI